MIHTSVVRRIRGVALILSNPCGEVLLLEELQTKPHLGKYKGMLSPPMETCLEGETKSSALDRLIEEELPGFVGHVKIDEGRRGVYRIASQAWASLYVGQIEDLLLPTFDEKSDEIGGYFWLSPKDALASWLRRGASEMLSDYIEGRMNVVCRHCRPVSSSPRSEKRFSDGER